MVDKPRNYEALLHYISRNNIKQNLLPKTILKYSDILKYKNALIRLGQRVYPHQKSIFQNERQLPLYISYLRAPFISSFF